MALTTYSENAKSGTATSTDTATALSTLASVTDDATNGVITIQVETGAAAGVEVIALGSSTGILVANDGVPVNFFCDSLEKLLVKRQGGSNISFRWFAF